MKTNDELIKEYIQSRGLKKTTHYAYYSVLEDYSRQQQCSLYDLIQEADTEEEERVRWKNRRLKQRLINYMNYLKANMKITSARTYFNVVKSFYHHHEIEIRRLPRLNLRNSSVSDPILYSELPDRDIIIKALEISDQLMRVLILFLVTTGMSKIDALDLTINDFIEATSEYHNGGSIIEILKVLDDTLDIIPIFKHRRRKTNKFFITFTTPECVREIIVYLRLRNEKKPLTVTDKLFQISKTHYTVRFELINDALSLGRVGSYNRFRGHMLRKFHASNLEKAGMNRYQINVMQGKSNGAVDDVYFLEDTEHLRGEFVKYMYCLVFNSDVNMVDVYSNEYLEVLEENKMLREQNERIQSLEEDLENIKGWYNL